MPSLPAETCVNSRRTRFVLVSDTHSTYPKLPSADVVIHAGDATNQGSYSELKRTLDWLDKADAEVKIIIAGELTRKHYGPAAPSDI
jgi:predicted phosphodiesterase